jgi:beta-lactamase class A
MGAKGLLSLVVLFSLCPLCLCGDDPSLEARLAPLAKAHKGKVAIAVKHLGSGETYFQSADEVLPTASLIKLPVLIEVYQQVSEGKIKLTDPITLRESDKVPGSGVLTEHFSAGATFPLQDAVRLMIVFSDNTATNLVLDKIGIESTAKRMEAWGWPNTKIHAKVFKGSTTSVFPERSKKYGLGSTTAREMVEILEKLHDGKLVSADACKAMIEHLKSCDDRDKITRFLPPKTVVAHKTGSVSDARTDAGIIYLPNGGGEVALCVLTADNEDKSWLTENAGNVFCARVAKEVFEYFTAKAAASPAPAKDKVIPPERTPR